MASSKCPQEELHHCFQSWMNQQKEDLKELDQVSKEDRKNEEKLKFLAEKNIKHFQDYHEKRILLIKEDPPSSFSPTWCTPFENSLLWVAGCRPSLAIQLVYTLCGSELEANLSDILQGLRKGNMGELSSDQLTLVNELHVRTIREEDKISNRMEILQEDICEQQMGFMLDESTQFDHPQGSSSCIMSNGYTGKSFVDDRFTELSCIWEDADKLRLNTLKELINIMTPIQGVDFLVASKKLYLSMHEWGQKRRKDSNPEHYVGNPNDFKLGQKR